MDYSLGALKLLCNQLKNARQAPSQKAFTLGGILFQRAWLQGVLVSTPLSSHSGGGGFHLDDGTGVIELLLSGDFRNRNWETGMYVMVVGFYSIGNDGTSSVKDWSLFQKSQISGMSTCKRSINIWNGFPKRDPYHDELGAVYTHTFPAVPSPVMSNIFNSPSSILVAKADRESMWYLEVIEVFKMFYQPTFQE